MIHDAVWTGKLANSNLHDYNGSSMISVTLLSQLMHTT